MTWTRSSKSRSSRLGTLLRIGIFLFALTSWVSRTNAAPSHPACHPQSAVRSLMKTYEDQYENESFEKRKAFLEDTLKQFPKSIALHREYQNLIRYESKDPNDLEKLKANYEKLYKQFPNDPDILYLYARTFLEDQPEKAAEVLNRALEIDPNHPWVHLALAYHYGYQKPIDKQKAAKHAIRALFTCPDVAEFYSYLPMIQDRGTLGTLRNQLRKVVKTHLIPETAPLYRTLWKLEFQLTPPPEHDKVREQIRQDLQQLETLQWVHDYDWWDLLHYGYEQLGDKQKLQSIENEVIKRFPQKSKFFVYNRLLEKANKLLEHPEQLTDEKIREGIAELDTYLKKMPDVPVLWFMRLKALSYMKSPPKEEIIKTARRFLETNKPNRTFSMSSGEIAVARIFNQTGVNLEQVEDLVKKGLQSIEEEHRRELKRLRKNDEALKREWRSYIYRKWDAENIRFRSFMNLKRWDRADESLKRMEALLNEMKGRMTEDGEDRRAFTSFNQGYWHMKIELAIESGHFADAIAYFQEWLRWRPSAMKEKEHPLAVKMHKMWLEHGGSEESWQRWIHRLTEPGAIQMADFSPWTRVNKVLPPFEVYDLSGKTWKPEDLKNRTVLINFWATWCGPCKSELPYLQKLYEKIKDRPDTLLLTFNVDEDMGLVKPFVEENHYTFPVLLAGGIFNSMVDEPAIPQLWIVDPEGRIRLIQIGFGSNPAEWEKTILEALDSFAKEKEISGH